MQSQPVGLWGSGLVGSSHHPTIPPSHAAPTIKSAFPIFAQHPTLHYLDSAASTQKPSRVIERMARFYEQEYANIHRGVYALSAEATARYDEARAAVARFINAREAREVVFTRGTTEGINLVAQAWGAANVRPGDEILVTEMEHHSNFVPWQMLAQRTGAVLRAIPVTPEGELDLAALPTLLTPRTRVVALTHASNALGTVNPVQQVARQAHAVGALVVVDAAQSVPHGGVDVQALECDFLAFSSHKLFGPTGIGVLWGRAELLEAMDPWQGGGGMIARVSLEETTWAEIPSRFEAGTPAIAQAVGLGEAIQFVESLGMDALVEHEMALAERARRELAGLRGVRVIGSPAERVAVVSFVVDGAHPHDVGTVLDGEGVAIRAGHHCAQPLMRRLGLVATARASFSAYNTEADVDALISAVAKARDLLA